jgi:hypothetical protein
LCRFAARSSAPFGTLVFAVKAALPQENVSPGEIFAGSVPFLDPSAFL